MKDSRKSLGPHSGLRDRVEKLFTDPGAELGRGARLLRFQAQLWRFCFRRLRHNNALAMSAALSFRTIFALIPVIVLAVLVMASLGYLEDAKRGLQGLLAASGVSEIVMERSAATQPASPNGGTATGDPQEAATSVQGSPEKLSVADLIAQHVDSIGKKLTFGAIGPVGGALLIWTALTLLTTMERSLNRIFQAPRSRPLGRSILLYWAIVTLVPILMVAGSYAGGKLIHAAQGVPGLSQLLAALGWLQPVLVAMLLLAAVYALTPNTRVRYRAALGGAVVVVPLWMIAKWLFSLYVGHVANNSLYGALGLLPLFLMWLNTSWWFFLFGAELAHTGSNVAQMAAEEMAEKVTLGPADLLAAIAAVARPYQAGQGPATVKQVRQQVKLPSLSVQELLDHLVEVRMLCAIERDGEPAYALARPPEKIPVMEVLGIAPQQAAADASRYGEEIARTIEEFHRRAGEKLENLTLADALAEPSR